LFNWGWFDVTAPLVALFGGIFGFLVFVVYLVVYLGLVVLVFLGALDTLGLVLFFLGITVVGRAVELVGVSL
jgi:hypothetical protein